ncbi:MAG: glycosyltransferase family 4 protein [Candidatus Acidiferrales bacterium]|jgi:phosphatidylinositol alpha-1,6-mannosyltransferase
MGPVRSGIPRKPKRGAPIPGKIIAMIAGLFTDLLSNGGIQYAARQTAAVLAGMARGRSWPVSLLSLNDPPGKHRLSVAGQVYDFQGFGRSKFRFILAALKVAAQKPSVVFANHPNLAPVAMAIRMLSPRSRVVVMTFGIEVWETLPLIRRAALRRAAAVTSCSTYTAEKLVSVQHVASDRVFHIPLSLDPQFMELAESAPNLPPPQGFPEGRIILSVGRWAANERYKGLDHLIQALPELQRQTKNLYLVAVGDGDDRPRLEALARETGVANSVIFLRGLSRADLVSCFARCEVFALPSAGEGFGYVFIEAMALGKPTVGGAHGGTPDIIQDGDTGYLVTHGDVVRLTMVIGKLLQDDSLRMEMGRRAGQHVRANFIFSQFESRLSELLLAVPMSERSGA